MLEVEHGVADQDIRSHSHFEVLQCIDGKTGTGGKKVLSDDRERLNFLELMSLSTVPMALKAITLLDVPQIMADGEQGSMLSARQISKRVSKKANAANVNVDHLDRILRFLASCEIFEEDKKVDEESGEEEQVYGLTPICKYLLRNAGGASLSTLLLVRHDKQLFQSLHHLHDAVLGDDVPFEKAHDHSLFDFLEANPLESHLFNTAMSDMSEIYMGAIVNNYGSFKDIKTLVDVGGGTGSSLAMILAKYPHIQGVNFDLPHVVAGAPEYDGMKHVGGNMFEKIPSGDGMYLKVRIGKAWFLMLQHIMHNWSDDACTKVLKNCHKSLKNGGKIIMVEFLAPEPGDHSQRARVALSYDLVMMAHFLGKERSELEFRGLLKAAGFSQIRIALRVDCIAVVEAHKNMYAR